MLSAQVQRVEILQARPDASSLAFPDTTGRGAGQGSGVEIFRKAWQTCARPGIAGPVFVHDFRRTAVRNMVTRGRADALAMTITGTRRARVSIGNHIVSPRDLRSADGLRYNSGTLSPSKVVTPLT